MNQLTLNLLLGAPYIVGAIWAVIYCNYYLKESP